MTTPRTLATYGAPFVDAIPVDDPTTTETSSQHNRLSEDTAQLTRTAQRAWVQFTTSTGAAGSIAATAGQSMMGTGSAQLPTIAKTATGLYTITYPTSWTDGLDQAEQIYFGNAWGKVCSTSTFGHVQCTASGSVISVAVTANVSGVDTLSDLGGAPITIWAD